MPYSGGDEPLQLPALFPYFFNLHAGEWSNPTFEVLILTLRSLVWYHLITDSNLILISVTILQTLFKLFQYELNRWALWICCLIDWRITTDVWACVLSPFQADTLLKDPLSRCKLRWKNPLLLQEQELFVKMIKRHTHCNSSNQSTTIHSSSWEKPHHGFPHHHPGPRDAPLAPCTTRNHLQNNSISP